MGISSTEESSAFLSTAPAGRLEWRTASAVALVSFAFFVAIAPFAKSQLPAVHAFIPAYQSALLLNDLITAVLLLSQFRILRSRALLILATGYFYTSAFALAHGLTFPGAFSEGGLLGAGPQSTAWMYMFWHAGFPLFVIGYTVTKGAPGQEPVVKSRSVGRAIALSIGGALVAVLSLTALATAGQHWLPAIMRGNSYTPSMLFVVTSVCSLSAIALAVLARRRPHSVLDVSLMLVMGAWLFDIALSAVLNGGRYDVGFYAGRIYGLVAASFVLILLLLENSSLYEHLDRANAELIVANRDLESFSYSVSHDLRAPVRSMSGFAQILLDDYRDSLEEEAVRRLEVIHKNAGKMGQMIDDLLAFARLGRQALARREISIDELVRKLLDELKSDFSPRQIDFRLGNLGSADVDPSLLRHVLDNLLRNAIKFTRQVADARIEVGCQAPERGAGEPRVFFVRDNGAGFDMRYANKLFGVFQRLHSEKQFEGTGIGLAICQRVIQLHGGRIWAESKPGEGATFYFTVQAG